MYNNLYCKIYLDSKLEVEDLYQYINSVVIGEMESIRTIKTDWGELDLRRNRDFEPKKSNDNPDGFLFWQYYLDIEPIENVEESTYITKIAQLLSELRLKNIKVRASCDFEKKL